MTTIIGLEVLDIRFPTSLEQIGSDAVHTDGTAWAGATDLRLLRRRGATWERIRLEGEIGDEATVLAAQPVQDWVIAVTGDGRVLQGQPVS